MKIRLAGRIVDNCCLFCGVCSGIGYVYIGRIKENNNIESIDPKGWLVIPHLSNCEVVICPECAKKIKKAGINI